MPFTMPTDARLVAMTPDEIENLRIEADNAANEISKDMTTITLARNDLARQSLELADKLAKARSLLRDYKVAEKTLTSLFFRKRKGY